MNPQFLCLAAAGQLNEALLHSVKETCSLALDPGQWLKQGEVWRAGCPDLAGHNQSSLDSLAQDIRRRLSPLPVDVALMAPRQKKLAVFAADMDKTMVGQECIDELAREAGVGDEVKAITKSAMAGEIDFTTSLKARVALLKGLDESVIARLLDEVITISPGAPALISYLNHHGVDTLLVSGGFTCFAEVIGRRIGFGTVRANQLAVKSGQLTGFVPGDIVDGRAKARILQERLTLAGATPEQSIAIGDGANDIDMLSLSGFGIAYRAGDRLKAVASLTLDHAGLDSLCYVLS